MRREKKTLYLLSKIKEKKGFTLLELMVIIGIMVILSLIVLPNYRQGERQFLLQRTAHKLAEEIRAVQNMAISGRECPECGGQKPDGYGIYIDAPQKEIIVYADTNDNQFYGGGDGFIRNIELEKGVIVKQVNTPPNKVCINFKPPDPKIVMKYPIGGGGDAEFSGNTIITLALEVNINQTKTIIVNAVGLIDVD